MLKKILEKKVYLVYAPLAVYWAAIAVATSIPAKSLPKTSINDKIEHILAYFGLGFLLSFALYAQGKYIFLKNNYAISALLITLIYAVVDEIHQLLIPGRQCDILDMIADLAGAIAGIILIKVIVKIFIPEKINY
ncbi:MAG: VanZ family protein [Ignavibacteriaceae bacterium]|nr:VanZ family protein [Ignavibacteriaceae bacterium]